jgi:hypothetical protein
MEGSRQIDGFPAEPPDGRQPQSISVRCQRISRRYRPCGDELHHRRAAGIVAQRVSGIKRLPQRWRDGKHGPNPRVTIRTSGLPDCLPECLVRCIDFSPALEEVWKFVRISTACSIRRATELPKQCVRRHSRSRYSRPKRTRQHRSYSDQLAFQVSVVNQNVDRRCQIARVFPPDEEPLSGVVLQCVVSWLLRAEAMYPLAASARPSHASIWADPPVPCDSTIRGNGKFNALWISTAYSC